MLFDMNSRRARPARPTFIKAVIHIDIWEAIFEQLAVLEYYGTLAQCAQLSRELSGLALRHLYSQANQQQLSSNANDQSILAADQVTARNPDVRPVGPRILRDLTRMAQDRDLHVMLKSLTIDRWTHVFPVIRFFTQLESLSLVFIDGLGTSAANIITRHLPKLRTFSVVQADESHAQELASFLSNLKADQLRSLHVFSTGYYGDFYRALETQQLEYLFVAECPDREIISHSLGWRERGGHVMTAVLAMPCLRDLRLHTYFPLGYRELEHIAIYVPRLETISFVCRQGENPTWTLRALENFKHLTGLTVLGLTVFSSRDMLRWIEWTQCHLRPEGFSLSLPTQDRRSWFRGVGVSDYTYINDPATERIKQMLRFFAVYVRDRSGHGEVWRGNDYEFDEERMFVHLWDDIRGPAEALQLLRGSGPYPPFMGLMENMGTRIV
ncbi:hypothetical protein EsH8_IV_000184 [Colletotrichum jinshuiense]